MRNYYQYMKGFFIVLSILVSTFTFGQGFIDLSSNAVTPWLPDGSLRQTFSNVGTPPVTVTASIEGSTSRFNNNTPRVDDRGLWLSMNLGSRLQAVTISFTFSEPVTNLSFGVLGIDRELSFSNYQDRIAIEGYDDNGAGVIPNVSYNPSFALLTDGTAPFIKVLSGFNADPFDSTRSTVNFRNAGIKRLKITYGSGSDIRNGALSTQSIFLTNLAWSNIVPVQLIYFRGKAEADRVRLSWATATEINSDYFNIERSTDLREFDTIGKIGSAVDSRRRLEYGFLDEAPLPGINYYRLKQVDKDGTSEFSKIIAVSPQASGARLVVYPNPSDGSDIRVQFDNLELDALKLVNILGQEIPFEMQANTTNSLTILPKHLLETGLYFVTYLTSEKGRVTQKLLVNR